MHTFWENAYIYTVCTKRNSFFFYSFVFKEKHSRIPPLPSDSLDTHAFYSCQSRRNQNASPAFSLGCGYQQEHEKKVILTLVTAGLLI